MPRPPRRSCRAQRWCGGAPGRKAPLRHQAVADDHLDPLRARSRVSSRSRSRARRARSPRRRRPTRSRRHGARDRRDRGAVVRRATPGRRPRPPDRDARPDVVAKMQPEVDRLRRRRQRARGAALREQHPRASATCTDVIGDNPLEIGRRAALDRAGQRQRPGRDRRSSSRRSPTSTRSAPSSATPGRSRRRRSRSCRPGATTLDAELASLEQRASATAAAPTRATASRGGRRDRDDRRADPQRDVVALTVAPAPPVATGPDPAARHRRGQPAPQRPVPRVHPGA